MSDWSIPLSDLDFGPEEMAAAQRVLHGKWLSLGPEVQTVEREFAEFQGIKHAFAVANGTAGLHLCLLSLGVGPGDEVVQPALNFVAAANMTLAAGATPVFADIVGLDEPTIDPEYVKRLITPSTKAVVVMHYGGNLCRMAELHELCQQHGIPLIEDACHAIGARYQDSKQRYPDGLRAGSIGDISAFSFFSNKNMATGEGGMIVTNRDDLAERSRLLRSHGMTSLTWDRHKGHASSYNVVLNGYNYRLDELHAALGRAQLQKLEMNNERRRQLITLYVQGLRSLKGWVIPFSANSANTAGHLMVVLAPSVGLRNRALEKLREYGIQTSLHYPCIPDFAAFERFRNAELNITREFTSRAITLPLFPTMSHDQVSKIIGLLADH